MAEKERAAASSSGSHEGMAVSGDGEVGASKSMVKGRASFLFFEEDVLTVSCPGSSGGKTAGAGWRERRWRMAVYLYLL